MALREAVALASLDSATVSRALLGKGYMSQKTRDAALKAAQELGFPLDLQAQKLAKGRCHKIIAFLSDSDLGVLSELAFFIDHRLDVLSFEVQMYNIPRWIRHFEDRQAALANKIRRQRPLGCGLTPWNGKTCSSVLVIGRNALKGGTKMPGDLKTFVQTGGRVLLSERDPYWWRDNPSRRFPAQKALPPLVATVLTAWHTNPNFHKAGLDKMKDFLFSDLSTREAFAGDKWTRGPLPDFVARPRNTEEVAQILHHASHHELPVTTRGAGWGYVGGCVANQGGILLSLDRLNVIREISTSDFVAVVEAGVLTGTLQKAARAQGLFYPPDPASLAHSTLGGNIAANAGGPRCLKYGVTRAYVLGLEVVLANGQVLNLGGRTHKNKTGFDLLGLMVGSEGMLGVVTGATLRLLPHPPFRAGLAAVFPNIESAASGVGAIFEAGILPAAVEVADATTLRCFREMQGLPPDELAGAHLLIECDGQEAGVKAEIAGVVAALKNAGATRFEVAPDESSVEELWSVRRAFSMSLNAPGRAKLNEDIVVPRGKLVELVAWCQELGARHNVGVACFGHAGDGNIHVNLLIDAANSVDSAQLKAQSALDELFAQVLSWGGAVTGEHGIGLAKKRWWPVAADALTREYHAKIKAQFDPQGILNPGKWLE